MANPMLAGFKSAMSGATKDYKAQLQQSVPPEVYRDICTAALQILGHRPKNLPLGTVSAAFMLAALSFAEGSAHADVLIQDGERE